MRTVRFLLALGLISMLFVFAVPVAAAGPVFTSTPALGGTLVFPGVPVGSISNAPFQIRNTGDAPLTIDPNPTFSGPHAGDFSELIVATFTVQPQQTLNMTPWLRCRPTAVGLRTATLTITTNDPLQPSVSYPVECTGIGPIFVSTPLPANSNVNFAGVLVGTSVSIDLTIENQGNSSLNVSLTSLTGTGAAAYSVAGLPLTIDPGSSKTMTLTCTPASTETFGATLRLATNDPARSAVSYFLSCTGIAPTYGSVPPPGGTLDLGSTAVDTTISGGLTLNNTGSSPLQVELESLAGDHDSDFDVDGLPASVEAGGQATVIVLCTPSEAGQRTAMLVVITNDSAQSSASYSLICEGVQPPTETPTPTPTPTETPTETPITTETPTETATPSPTPTMTETPNPGSDYHICPRFDQDKLYKANRTVKIKIEVCDADGENHSSFDLGVTAVSLVHSETGEERPAQAPGHSNPANSFSYNHETGTYCYNLKSTGLSGGTWNLVVSIEGDPNPHLVSFKVR